MPDVKLLNLQYNELKTLPEKLRNIFTNVKKVYLDGNPWSCDKRLDWLLRWMRETDIEFYSVDPPTCESPASLSGRELTALRSSDLADVKDEDKNERSKGQVQLKQENQSRIVKNPNTGVSVSKTNIPSVLAKLNGSKDAQQTKTNTKTKKGKGRKRKGKGRKRKNRKGKKRNRKRGSKKRRTDKRGKRRITGRTRRKCTKLPDGKRKCCRTMKDGTERCRIRNKRVKKKKAATTPAPVLGNLS
ncbi:hypothetical protein FSP39_004395 [Pinctada imbricata]|uniref:LRRCT domain-containing protein n=1 Tax=Pinctada imbricata TaxID=66713 RepID=A0AA88YQF3_PINIB|nr:hypothetical protein FSP39_004395 [Pinctada imbricata]